MIDDESGLDLDKKFARGDHVELAEELVRRLKSDGDTVFADGQFWKFNCVTFRSVPPEDLSIRVQSFAGKPVATAKGSKLLTVKSSDVTGVVKLARDRLTDHDYFLSAPAGLVFSDTFVSVSAKGTALSVPGPEHRARFAYDFPYQPDLVPELWFKFLADVFGDDDDGWDKISLLQEYVGVSLLGLAPKYQSALLLKGEGSNGKGVLVRIIESCFPKDSVTAIPPQEWSNEYRRAMVAGKFLNIVAELPDSDILASEAFKAIVAGDLITGRHIREAPFKFASQAGQIFSVNPPLPGTNDHSHAFWRRWLMLEFNRVIDENEKIVDLADKIIEEKAAIVPWFLQGAERVLARGRFAVPPSSITAVDAWRGQSDQILAFVRDCCEKDAIGTLASSLYYDYEEWARRTGHRAMTQTRFGLRMKNLGLAAVHRNDGNHYPVRCMSRLKI